MVGMITIGIIRNGGTYLSQHLRKNDYWAEGEKEVCGEWIGEGARALGLSGEVTDEPFEALRLNRNPRTGERLTAREHKNRVAFFDIQLAAPNDVSVLAMVGCDERVRLAFAESVRVVLAAVASRISVGVSRSARPPKNFCQFAGDKGSTPTKRNRLFSESAS
jgi:conjugative relaxase-like TrwC/TraI family protein